MAVPRAAIGLAAVIVLAQVAFSGIDAVRLSRERDRLRERQESVFRAAFPEAKAIVDPELQMSRNLEELRRTRGMAGGDDFLAQLTRVARDSKSVKSVEYSSGRMVAR
jgi:general secretion pathway protein L